MLKKEKKKEIMEGCRISNKDSGSPEVQIALLSEQIKELSDHLKKNPKDNHSRKGLVDMVEKRKKLLNYLKKNDKGRHKEIIKKVGLKS